ncbi:MAG TPA: cytochrome-c peroxidase [Blastocatellia bacterium]
MNRRYVLGVLVISSVAVFVWQEFHISATSSGPLRQETSLDPGNEPIQPIPRDLALDSERVKLGEQLFHDPRLSRDNSVSCATCHNLATGGCDRLVRSTGINGQPGVINAPSIFNTGMGFRQFWDGRAATLEEQIDGPIQSPVEMGSNWTEVISKLAKSLDYAAAFTAVYKDGLTPDTVKSAIATFERSLRTPDCRFDRYLRGETSALNDEEKRGYEIFKSYGCISCHQGVNIGGNMFQTFGVMADYFADRGHITRADYGRYNVTGDENDRYVFKVPSLRNVELTAPYFHDGSAKTLDAAVQAMGKYQLGRHLSPDETGALVSFLKTLTGTYKGSQL